MTLFTEGRLQAYERMMQDTGRNRYRDYPEKNPESSSGRKSAGVRKSEKKNSVKNGVRHGNISG